MEANENTVKLSIVIQSLLNDARIDASRTMENIRFVSFLIHHHPDTTARVDVEALYEKFKAQYN